jgi:thiol:disulfide interchange protein DsbD
MFVFCAVAALLAGSALTVLAAPVDQAASPKVRVELVGEFDAIAPGQSFWVGLRQRIAPGWHTYWINPGDSGEPATVEWALPRGFGAGAILWPHPERIPVGPFMSYGYTGEVVLLTRITAPQDLEPGAPVRLRGQARWLVCEKICIPEETLVALTLPVTSGKPSADPQGAALIARARQALPVASPWMASFSTTPDTVSLTVAAGGLARERIADVWFYPAQWGVIEHAAPQEVSITDVGITLRATRGALAASTVAPIEGVLVVTERLDGGTASLAFNLRAVSRGLDGSTGTAALPALTLLQAIALALAGGLVLNLMPCVLPVLSVKALALVHHAGARAAILRWHGVAYTAGVLASFGVVAAVLIALRAGGEQLGWGFQLQSPLVVIWLADVLFVLALSLSGVVRVGGRLAGAGHALTARRGYTGSFFSGALATVAATPCTAPFMGVAVGFALAQPWTTALLVFEALGFGLALPFLLLALVPAWRRLLPRPGPWTERLKQFLAFPLYGSVAWLVWVVSQQAGPRGVGAALAGLVLIGLATWLYEASRTISAPWRQAVTAAVVFVALAAVGLGPVIGAGPASPATATAQGPSGVSSGPFSLRRVAELRAQGTPVFVDFTAAWCITCLVNERVALRSPAVAEAFARKGVVYLKADWTSRDPQIAQVLESFGRSGVPLYLLYPPSGAGRSAAGEPTVLPQILSEGMIIEAIERI